MVLNPLEHTDNSEIKRLLRIRKTKKRNFRRHMAWRWVKLDDNWRYPNGRDNKMRLQYKGYPPKVKVGYRTPRKTRFLHPSGKIEVLVRHLRDLYNIDPLTQVVRIASNVGGRKRLAIIKFAEKFGIKVLNPGKLPVIAPVPTREAIPEEEIEKLAAEIAPEEELEKELAQELEELSEEESTEEKTKEELESILAEELENLEDEKND